MSVTYLCKKCNLKTGHYNNLKKHLNNKKQCIKNLEAYKYSDDQILILTLLIKMTLIILMKLFIK